MRDKLRALLRNTRLRYIISYMLITVLLIGGIGVYMYSYYSKSVLESSVSGETSLMYQIKYLCDGYMRLMESSAARLGMLDETEYSDAAKLIQITGDSSELVLISGKDTNGLVYEDTGASELSSMISAHEYGVLPVQNVVYNGSSGEYITFIYPIENSSRSVLYLLPVDSLRLITESDDVSLRSRYILIDGTISAKSEGFSMDEANITRLSLSSSDEASGIRRVNGREYMFLTLAGSDEHVKYVSVLALTGIRSNAAVMWLGFAAFMLVLAVPCLAFMLFISRRNLKPIVELGRRFGSTGGDEISSIDRGIKGLEGENAALNSIVTDSLPARRHMFIKQLVQGLAGSRSEIIIKGSELGIDAAHAYMSIILTGRAAEDVAALAPAGVSAAGTDMLERNEFLILAFADETSLLDSFAENVFKSVNAPTAISNVHDAFEQLPGAYLEAGAAYESRFIMGTSHLLRFSSIPISGKGHTDTVKYIDRIKAALANADTQALDVCLNELTLYLKSGDMTLFGFRKFYNDIISAVAAEAGDAFTSQMYDLFSLSECSSVDELDGILRSVCGQIISGRSKEKRVSPVQALASAISDSYTDPEFSLAAASEKLGIAGVRLSAEFKAAFGMTPADYLTMLRMEQAKKLLAETELPVRDIASGSGYADASSFTRRFRIYTGNTPLQYRQEAKNSELLDT